MRSVLGRALWLLLGVWLLADGATPNASAAPPSAVTPNPAVRPARFYGPFVPVPRTFYVQVPVTSSFAVGPSTVVVPDGGSVLVGGYSFSSEGRTEFGTPILGKVPYAGRGFRNVGYGRTIGSRSVRVGVRVIDLAEEEERQTGVSSR